MACTCEHGTKSSDSITGGEFLTSRGINGFSKRVCSMELVRRSFLSVVNKKSVSVSNRTQSIFTSATTGTVAVYYEHYTKSINSP